MRTAVGTLIPESTGAAVLAATTAAAVVVLGLMVALFAIRRRWRLAVLGLVAGAGVGVVLALTAWASQFLPPRLLVDAEEAGEPGSVTGAAAAFVVSWGLLTLVTLPAVPARRRRWIAVAMTAPALIPGIAVAVLVEGSLGAVVVGWVLGVGWLVAVGLAFRWWRRRHEGARQHQGDGHVGDRPAGPAAGQAWDLLGVGREVWVPARVRLLPAGGWTVLGLAAGATTIVVVFIGAGLALVEMPADWAFARWDARAPEALNELRTPTLTFAVSVVSSFSNTVTVVVVSLSLAVIGVAVVGTWRPALVIVVVVAGEGMIYFVVSRTVGRDRPPTEDLSLACPRRQVSRRVTPARPSPSTGSSPL